MENLDADTRNIQALKMCVLSVCFFSLTYLLFNDIPIVNVIYNPFGSIIGIVIGAMALVATDIERFFKRSFLRQQKYIFFGTLFTSSIAYYYGHTVLNSVALTFCVSLICWFCSPVLAWVEFYGEQNRRSSSSG